MNYSGLYNAVLVNFGLLIIRLVVGLVFIGHGSQKLFGWFGGYGVKGTGEWLESMGIKSGGNIWAILAGTFEFAGGLLFASGVLTPVAAGLIIVVMIDAIATVHFKNGLWITNNGYEYNLVLIALALGVALIGPGNYTLLL